MTIAKRIDLDAAIALFRARAQEWKTKRLTGRQVAAEVVALYTDFWIAETERVDEGDKLLFAWGMNPNGLPYLSFTRQLMVSTSASGQAVPLQLILTLGYEATPAPVRSRKLWISGVEELELLVGEYFLVPEIADLLDRAPAQTEATVHPAVY